MTAATNDLFAQPAHFLFPPEIKDTLATATSAAQDETLQECLPLINGTDKSHHSPFDYNRHGVLRLDRSQHVNFLRDALGEFPRGFVTVDASRPWMVYYPPTEQGKLMITPGAVLGSGDFGDMGSMIDFFCPKPYPYSLHY
jgi:hypothetical protein